MEDLEDLNFLLKRKNDILDVQNIKLKFKSVLITGAGGSIGSELSRQLASKQCKQIYLLDNCELNLFSIYEELKNCESKVTPILIDLVDRKAINSFLKKTEIEAVYHVAAYKHVNLLQMNKYSAIKNNVLGTKNLIEGTLDKIKYFTQVSTDKAVNPINIMGTTKRISEILTLDYARKSKKTLFNIVRFGNVLHSSGSVIPIFKKQIKNTNRVTVTDKKATRYFMTIPEAAQLVIQAGAMGKVGDIFLLNMGEPVHVLDLAKDMIRLSGMTIKDHQNPDGDIEIIFTGLRPGEKLVEELLIDNRSDSTQHKKIMRANERGMEWNQLSLYISRLEKAIEISDFKEITDVFTKTVSGYSSSK